MSLSSKQQSLGDCQGKVQQYIILWLRKTANIVPASLWENGCFESFDARFRDEFLNGEIFYSLGEAQILFDQWLGAVPLC